MVAKRDSTEFFDIMSYYTYINDLAPDLEPWIINQLAEDLRRKDEAIFRLNETTLVLQERLGQHPDPEPGEYAKLAQKTFESLKDDKEWDAWVNKIYNDPRFNAPHRMSHVRALEMASLLFVEIKRLLAGDFTPEEFQNLCHKFNKNDKCAFYDGCAAYQRKLFGQSDRYDLLQQLQERIDRRISDMGSGSYNFRMGMRETVDEFSQLLRDLDTDKC